MWGQHIAMLISIIYRSLYRCMPSVIHRSMKRVNEDFRRSCLSSSSSCICSCNKYVQYVTVATGTRYRFMRETNYMFEKHSRKKMSYFERNVVKLAQTNIRRFRRLTYNAFRADYFDFVGGPTMSAE